MKVWVLQHVHTLAIDTQDVKLIGVNPSEQRASDTIARLSKQPGYAGSKEGFCVDDTR